MRALRVFSDARALSLLALLAAWLGPVAASASTIPYRTDGDLVALSDRVVHGRVLAVRTATVPGSGRIYTVTRLAVLEDFTGVDEREIEVRELGGRVGDREMWIPGAARFDVGDQRRERGLVDDVDGVVFDGGAAATKVGKVGGHLARPHDR